MRSMINGKRYDTDTAEEVAEVHHGEDRSLNSLPSIADQDRAAWEEHKPIIAEPALDSCDSPQSGEAGPTKV